MCYNVFVIDCIKNTSVYKSFNLSNMQAYLFYSNDKELNNNVALTLAKFLMCNNQSACSDCNACKQFDSLSHPDLIILDQPTIKVEDANNIISKLNTMPISARHKVFVVLNAENINEIAQNKLLKSIEEPTSSAIFIFTTTKTDKLLPTILSRFNKIYVPKLSDNDKIDIAKELKTKGIDIFKYINKDLNLTEMLNFTTNENYSNTLNAIYNLFLNLKTTQDIPSVATNLKDFDKSLFLPLLQDIFLNCVNGGNKFEKSITDLITSSFSPKAIAKCLPLIEDAYKKQLSNVNFSYILDNLLFNILKEKFLCR